MFQSRGWSSIIRAYSAMAGSSLPCRSSFSAFFSVSSRSMAKEGFSAGERCEVRLASQFYQTV